VKITISSLASNYFYFVFSIDLSNDLNAQKVFVKIPKEDLRYRTNPRLISTFEAAIEIMRAGNSADVIFLMNQNGWSKDKVRALLGKNIEDVYTDTIFASRGGTEF